MVATADNKVKSRGIVSYWQSALVSGNANLVDCALVT